MKSLLSPIMLFVVLTAAAHADLTPGHTEKVPNGISILTMAWEKVNITIGEKSASVTTLFHFTAPAAFKTSYAIGTIAFPELVSQPPLTGFTASHRQWLDDSGDPAGATSDEKFLPVQGVQKTGPMTLNGLADARWYQWPVELAGSGGKPMPIVYEVKLSYQQKLLSLKNKTWSCTYVLRSGKAWQGNIGRADLRVLVKAPRTLASALPKGCATHRDKQGVSLTWSQENFKPDSDITLVTK